MTKAELSVAVCERAGLTKTQAKAAVDATFDCITESLRAGDTVRLVGFGVFTPVARPAGTARNPRTGETVQRPAGKTVKFRVGDALKNSL